jgi:SIR2-like domain
MNKFEPLHHPDFASEYLSDRVIDGTLILFLGAGASAGFGLPGWTDFVNRFLAEAGINEVVPSTASSDERERALDRALRKINHDQARKLEIIRTILYRDRPRLDTRAVFSQELLIAVSALLIGRKRGHINRVVTFNYDSMLEWFLGIFGIATRSISQIPALEGSEDVRIYHPHGYVPHPVLPDNNSEFTIVGSLDANERASNINDLWWHKERDLLRTGVGLFIGLSLNTFRDRAVQPHLRDISEELKKTNDRPVGLWIFLEKMTTDEVNECLDYSIVPVQLPSKESVPEFILKICQTALEKTRTA